MSTEAMAAFLQRLERPQDLIEACRVDPAVGQAVLAVFETYNVAPGAVCIANTAQHVQEFCAKVAQALAMAGVHRLDVAGHQLSR